MRKMNSIIGSKDPLVTYFGYDNKTPENIFGKDINLDQINQLCAIERTIPQMMSSFNNQNTSMIKTNAHRFKSKSPLPPNKMLNQDSAWKEYNPSGY